MKFLALFLVGFITCFHSFAQTARGSSKNTPRKYKGDTALFNEYFQKAVDFSDKHKDSSLYYSKKAFAIAKSIPFPVGLARYYHFLAADYNEHASYDSGMIASQNELIWANRSGDTTTIAWAYNALANTYEYLGNMDSAAAYFIKALKITGTREGFSKLNGTLNYNLATVLFLIGEYQKALLYANKGYETGQHLHDVHMMSNSLLDIGSIHVGLKKYDTALKIFNAVIKLVKNTPDSNTIMDALGNMGDIYAKKKEFGKSIGMYNRMLALAKSSVDDYELLYAYGNLGITQYQAGNFRQADENLGKAIHIGLQLNARNELRQFYQSMSEVKESLNHFRAALLYRKRYDSLNEALMGESAKKNIHTLEVKYQTAQKDKEIAQQEFALSEKQRDIEEKNTWIGLFIAGLAALIAILALSFRSFRHKRKLQAQSVLALQRKHEVDTLKAKMEAREEERDRIAREMHDDVGSALTTILYLTDDLKTRSDEKNKSTADRISGTAGLVVDKMNEIIWSMNREYDTLDDLIAYTRQHSAQFLGNHEIDYKIDTPDVVPDIHLQGGQRRNMYLVIKESLHNIVKHACATKVDMKFNIAHDLIITIQDNGKGMNAGAARRFGNGLRNMKQRMEAAGGTFDIQNSNGTLITLKCPLHGSAV